MIDDNVEKMHDAKKAKADAGKKTEHAKNMNAKGESFAQEIRWLWPLNRQ